MKTSKPIALALSLMLASTSVLAQGGPGPGPGPDQRDERRPGQNQNQNQGQGQPDKRQAAPQNHGQHKAPNNTNRAPAHQSGGPHAHAQPGPGNFHKGDRLPNDYRGRQYVVDDWRAHRLDKPPRGHHWVQVGGEYVLVAIATGVIVSVLLNH